MMSVLTYTIPIAISVSITDAAVALSKVKQKLYTTSNPKLLLQHPPFFAKFESSSSSSSVGRALYIRCRTDMAQLVLLFVSRDHSTALPIGGILLESHEDS